MKSEIIDYILYLKETKKLAPHTLYSYVNAVRHFFEMNDITDLNWKKISKFKGKTYNSIEDRPYTREEILKLLNFAPTQRDKVMILLMSSGGLRVGALPGILLKDLTPMDKYSLYQIKVYARTEGEYVTFCTPECRMNIDKYLELRKRYGEQLKPSSPLLRKQFDTREPTSAAFHTEALVLNTVRDSMLTLLHKSGVRLKQGLPEHGTPKRSELMMHHAFRKFFDTVLETEGINPVYIEFLLGHDQKLKTRYAKPTPNQLLEGNGNGVLGYVQGIAALTINEDDRLTLENLKIRQRNESLEREKDEVITLRKELEPLIALKRH